MKTSGQCPKCGSKDLVGGVTPVAERALPLKLVQFRNRSALFFKGMQAATRVSAFVCRSCGFIELYADSAGTLRKPDV